MAGLFCEVGFPIPVTSVYTYRVPEALAASVVPGTRVRAPLGRDPGRCGVVLSVVHDPPPLPPDTVRDIATVLETPPFFDEEQLSLAHTIAARYLVNPGEVLEQMFQLDEVPRVVPAEDPLPRVVVKADDRHPLGRRAETLLKHPSNAAPPGRLLVPGSWDEQVDILAALIQRVALQQRQVLVVFAQVRWLRDTAAALGRRHPDLAAGVVEYSGELTVSRRYRVWHGCRSGAVNVVFATRSGAYLPLGNPGAIVVDEPDEPGHRSLSSPQVSTWEIACLRASLRHVPCVALAAAPSLEVRSSCTPTLVSAESPVPVRRSAPGERLSAVLVREAYKFRQAVVLYPWKGFVRSVVCARCRTPLRCSSCGMPVGYHMDERRYRCGGCGQSVGRFICAACRSTTSVGFGAGIQKVLSLLERHLPQVKVARMDADVPEKERLRIVEAFNRRSLDVILATRELFTYARALDWSNVSLAYIAMADALTYRASFRAVEQVRRTTALFRGFLRAAPSAVVVLEFYRDDTHAEALLEHEHMFVARETALRRELGYPPAVRLLQVVFSAPSRDALPPLDGVTDALGRIDGVQAFAGRETALRDGQARQTVLIKCPADPSFDWRPVLEVLRPLRTEMVRMNLCYDPDEF